MSEIDKIQEWRDRFRLEQDRQAHAWLAVALVGWGITTAIWWLGWF